MVFLRVAGNARDNLGAEPFILASKLIPPNVLTPVEAHYLKAWSSHFNLALELNILSSGPFNQMKNRSERLPGESKQSTQDGAVYRFTQHIMITKCVGAVGLDMSPRQWSNKTLQILQSWILIKG